MQTRVIVAAGAWLLGAVTATGGSLLAVSRLGEGLTAAHSQQLTMAAVNKALAGESAHPDGSPSVVLGDPASPISRSRAAGRRHASPPSPQPTGTVLTSPGGSVLAGCGTAGAYLESWSPQQGFDVGTVIRGPAPTVRVTFESSQHKVTMVISCSGGEPAATVHTGGGSWHDD